MSESPAPKIFCWDNARIKTNKKIQNERCHCVSYALQEATKNKLYVAEKSVLDSIDGGHNVTSGRYK